MDGGKNTPCGRCRSAWPAAPSSSWPLPRVVSTLAGSAWTWPAPRQADIIIAAIGKAEMIRGDWIKPGAYVIDVGTNRKEDPTKKSGYRLVGDVAYDEALEVAGAITPVPGGVGPMTIMGLMANTLRGAQMASA